MEVGADPGWTRSLGQYKSSPQIFLSGSGKEDSVAIGLKSYLAMNHVVWCVEKAFLE